MALWCQSLQCHLQSKFKETKDWEDRWRDPVREENQSQHSFCSSSSQFAWISSTEWSDIWKPYTFAFFSQLISNLYTWSKIPNFLPLIFMVFSFLEGILEAWTFLLQNENSHQNHGRNNHHLCLYRAWRCWNCTDEDVFGKLPKILLNSCIFP